MWAAVCRSIGNKDARGEAVSKIQQTVKESLANSEQYVDITPVQFKMAFKSVESGIMRGVIMHEGRRADGRGVKEIRPIVSRTNILPRTHGSALFTRGETQVRVGPW